MVNFNLLCDILSNMLKTLFLTLILSLSSSTETGINQLYFEMFDPDPATEIAGWNNSFDEDCALYGITIGEDWSLYGCPTNWTTFCKYYDKHYEDDNTDLQYETDIQHCVLRYKDTSTYAYICRMVLSPVCKERSNKKGDNWYFYTAKASMTLDSSFTIGDWSPKTDAPTSTTSYGIALNISSDPGIEISASFDVVKGLEIVSETNVASHYFSSTFDISGKKIDYNHNSGVFMTFLKFSTNGAELTWQNFPHVQFEFTYYGRSKYVKQTTGFVSNPFLSGITYTETPKKV